jgi:ABC-type phosphate transport system substrate-binding protein
MLIRARPSSHTFLAAFALLWSGLAAARAAPQPAAELATEGFRVVVNAASPVGSVDRATLERIFLKQSTRWPNGTAAQPVDQSATSAVRARFSQAVLERELAAVQAYWQQEIFAGRNSPPRVKGSDAAVIEWLLSEPEGVGYVTAAAELPEGVRQISILDSED